MPVGWLGCDMPCDFQALLDAIEGVADVADQDGIILQHSRSANERLPDDPEHPHDPVTRGSRVFDAIEGEPIRAIYRQLHQMIWSRRRTGMSFYYRCDTPGLERLMRMSMGPIQNQGEPAEVLYQSVLIHAVPRVPLPLFDNLFGGPDQRLRSMRPIVLLCSFCLSVGWPPDSTDRPDEWIAAPEYYRRGGRSDVAISHGVCEPCCDRVLAGVASLPPFTQVS